MALCWLVWIFLCPKVQISCVRNTVLSKLSLICKQNQAEFVAVVAAIHIIAQSLCDLPVKGVKGCCTLWNLYKPSWCRILCTCACATPVTYQHTYSSFVKSVRHFDYPTVLQHNTSTHTQPQLLAKTVYKQELPSSYSTASLVCNVIKVLK